MSSDILPGFEADIFLKNGGKTAHGSPVQLMESVLRLARHDLDYIEVRLECFVKSGLVSGFRSLFRKGGISQFASQMTVIKRNWEGFDEEISNGLNVVLNKIIRDGIKLKKLELIYVGDCYLRQPEVTALTKKLGQQHRASFPPISLELVEHRGDSSAIQLLTICMDLGWPIEKFTLFGEFREIKSDEWYQALRKKFQQGYKLDFPLKFVATDANSFFGQLLACLQTTKKGSLHVQGNFGVHRMAYASSFFSEFSVRNRRETNKTELQTLVLGFGREFYVKGSKLDSYYLSVYELHQLFFSQKLNLVEKLSLGYGFTNDPMTPQVFEAIMNSPHSLVSISDFSGERVLQLPGKLEKQIENNLSRKMGEWITDANEVAYGRMKLMVIGNGEAGKTTTINSLLGNKFDPNIKSTVVAKADKDVSMMVKTVGFSRWKETNFDNNWVSNEMGEVLNKMKGAVESGNQDVFANDTNYPKEEIKPQEIADTTPEIKKPKRVNLARFTKNMFQKKQTVFEKVDQPTQVFLDADVEKTILREQERYKHNNEVSGAQNESDNARLTIWDFGGQEVFYGLHHLFLTAGGIYILVFNLRKMYESTESELAIVEFWLQSVFLHVPNALVIMVGTRCDEVGSEDLKDVDFQLREFIQQKKFKVLESQEYIFFHIDNAKAGTIDRRLEPLKAKVLECFVKSANVDDVERKVWQKKVPLTWIYFMNHLVNRFPGTITSNQMLQTASDMNLQKERDIIPMLEFYRNAGGIIPFMKKGSDDKPDISDYIVLHPEWLLNALGNFIYKSGLHEKNRIFHEDAETVSLIENYETTGLLSETLLLQILKRANISKQNADFLLSLCKEMLLMSKVEYTPTWANDPSDVFYLVPTMNQMKADDKEVLKCADLKDSINIFVNWGRYIPLGLFERVICIMLTLNNEYDGTMIEPTIKKNFGRFYFREIEVFAVNEKENQDFRIGFQKTEPIDLNTLVNVMEIVEKLVARMSSDVLGKELKPLIQCDSSVANVSRCDWNDLKVSIEKGAANVLAMFPDGSQRLIPITSYNHFSAAAELMLKREREALIIQKEVFLEWEFDCFFAHTWGKNNQTHEKVLRIEKMIRKRGLRTWIDAVNLKHFIANDIVRGLKKSACILVFITELYLKKVEDKDTNASREFRYAALKGSKFLVPVVLDPKCLDPKSWFGCHASFILQDILYVDFSSKSKIKKNMNQLCDRIREMSTTQRPRTSFDSTF